MHKLSIITVNFNNCAGLARTCKSILDQDLKEFDWIVIDGASSDNSLDIFEIVKFSNLKLFSGPDSGIYNAMNKGLEKVTTEYVMFLNSGDILADSTITSKIQKVIKKNNADIIYGNIRIQYGTRFERYWAPGQLSFIKLLFGWCPPHPATIYSHSTLRDLNGYDESFSIAADYDAFIRSYHANHTIEYMNEWISVMEKPGESGGSLTQILKANLQVLKSWHQTYKFVPIWFLITKPASKIIQFKSVTHKTKNKGS